MRGHPSATSRAWDRDSSPVELEDRRSTTVPRSQPCDYSKTKNLPLFDEEDITLTLTTRLHFTRDARHCPYLSLGRGAVVVAFRYFIHFLPYDKIKTVVFVSVVTFFVCCGR